jgi:2-polyprenyl-6-methoxyphenol hydroxylase-like FAD-dependent oxidoreductase
LARRILITGGSIAGNTAAWWLGRNGFTVTMVERASAFREGGQNVDLRGIGREVLRRMGLEQDALARGTGEEGTAWVNAQGRPVARFAAGDSDVDGPTAEMEILRGDLAGLIFDAARPRMDIRFGDSVERIEQDADEATVTFTSGRRESFDLVIVAEGVGSSTREHVFPGENAPRPMDLTIAYFTIPRTPSDDRFWRWYNAPGGRSVQLRPDPYGTTRAMLAIHGPSAGEQDWDPDRQKAFLRARFADVGWEAPRVLAGLDATDDFYFDALRQVRMPRWSNGRVVLTGDAAWCVTPLAGIGTTLAVTGATVLACELCRQGDVAGALASYERATRPMVEEAAGVPKIAPRIMHPRSGLGIRLLHGGLRLASNPALRGVAAKLFNRKGREPDLSRYDGLGRG